MRYRTTLSIIAIAIATAGAQTSAPAISSIKLRTTSCFGTCPVYAVEIFSNGRVNYKGEYFVKVEGTRTRKISAQKFSELVNKVEEIGFFKLRPAYRSNWSDMPTTFVTVTRGRDTKQVEDYDRAPKRLHDLERLIEQTVDDWVNLSAKEAGAEMERRMRAYR